MDPLVVAGIVLWFALWTLAGVVYLIHQAMKAAMTWKPRLPRLPKRKPKPPPPPPPPKTAEELFAEARASAQRRIDLINAAVELEPEDRQALVNEELDRLDVELRRIRREVP